MRKLIALAVSIMFSLGVAGFAAAQTPAPAPKEDKKMEKMEKKETKADCLKMAKDDAAKKDCEKKYAKKKAAATEKKEEKK